MPDHQKKNQKQKPEPKDQRKPRQGKQQQVASKTEKKVEKAPEPLQDKGPAKSTYEEPPPEFYKNLKRETDDIIKITEDENAKYKKKEIQSNWAKYEMPIESYDDIEQENDGADFEQLIEASMSVGSHFQFKHEKTWDQCSAPSLYDKYFDINSNDLATALFTIPFYERNCLDKSLFTATDIQNMDSRTARFKQKYYNDNSYTPEAESQDRIIAICKEGITNQSQVSNHPDTIKTEHYLHQEHMDEVGKNINAIKLDKLEIQTDTQQNKQAPTSPLESILQSAGGKIEEDIDDIIFGKVSPVAPMASNTFEKSSNVQISKIEDTKSMQSKCIENQSASNAKPVVESPEDLEKWLDDFLDG